MLPSISDQAVYFLASVAFGAALSVLYGVLRLFRFAHASRTAAVIVSDVLFFVAAGVLTSLFALPFNKGEVRGFIILGEAAGFLILHLTVGSAASKLSRVLIMTLEKFGRKISKIVKKLFEKVLKFMHFILYNINDVIDKNLRKHLQKQPKQKNRNKYYEQKRKRKGQKAAACGGRGGRG